MTDLTLLLTDTKRSGVVADLADLAESAVHAQSGITGMAVKGALAAGKKMRPDIVTQGINRLLPDILGELDQDWKNYQESDAGAADFGAYLEPRSGEVAESLLNVSDRQIGEMNNQAVEKVYSSLRGRGSALLSPHVPELGRILEKHMD